VSVDWHNVFVPNLGIAEIVVRGTLMYLALFAILRFIGRRQAGHFGPADLLVIVLIADAAQNGLGRKPSCFTSCGSVGTYGRLRAQHGRRGFYGGLRGTPAI
jgi:hypothetical protein